MISFDILTSDNKEEIVCKLCTSCSDADSEYLYEIAEQLAASNDGAEYALAVSSGCLLIRAFDEEYFFLFPEPIAEDFNISDAIDELRLYAIREEIGLSISEVPSDLLDETAEHFAHTELIPEDEDCTSFTVRALSEIELAEELPSIRGERIALTGLVPEDEKKYAFLCRDEDTNKFWGYNYREDAPDCDDFYFLSTVGSELDRGVAASFALRLEGEFIGEAVFYAFDYIGGAECALRLLPEYRGCGLSRECLELLCLAAREMQLKRVYGTVDNNNIPSLRIFEKSFTMIDRDSERTRFLREM